MTFISQKRQQKIQKQMNEGRKMECLEDVEITKDEWDDLTSEYNIHLDPSNDYDQCYWHNPDKTIEVWTYSHLRLEKQVENVEICWNSKVIDKTFIDKIMKMVTTNN